jgi:hypothetical protein
MARAGSKPAEVYSKWQHRTRREGNVSWAYDVIRTEVLRPAAWLTLQQADQKTDMESAEERGGDPSKKAIRVRAEISEVKQAKIRKSYLRHNGSIHHFVAGK